MAWSRGWYCSGKLGNVTLLTQDSVCIGLGANCVRRGAGGGVKGAVAAGMAVVIAGGTVVGVTGAVLPTSVAQADRVQAIPLAIKVLMTTNFLGCFMWRSFG